MGYGEKAVLGTEKFEPDARIGNLSRRIDAGSSRVDEDRRPEVERALTEQAEAISVLSRTVRELEERLGPVLRVEPETVGCPMESGGYGSPLAQALDSQACLVRSVRAQVMSMMTRLEV